MKKQIVLSSSVEETRKELTEDDLYDLFKKKVNLLYPGENFNFFRSNEKFTAKTTDTEILANSSQPNLEQNLSQFLDENLSSKSSSIETRAYQCLKLFATSGKTVKDLLENRDSIKNYGEKAHNWTKSQFEQLGFNVSEYPFFQIKF